MYIKLSCTFPFGGVSVLAAGALTGVFQGFTWFCGSRGEQDKTVVRQLFRT